MAVREKERWQTFDRWLGEHRGLLLKVVRVYAFTPEDREDLLQEIALQLWDSIPRQRGESADSTWVYRVSLYAALAWTRRERRHRTGRLSMDESEHLLRPTTAERDERLEWLYDRIAELGEVDRSLMLLVLEGFRYRDMARILGMSESNVGVRISRIKQRFALMVREGAEK